MHANPAFRWEDRAAIRAFVAGRSFGMLFAATAEGPRVAHAPAVWLGAATLGLHLARGNALTRHLDGATGIFVVQGPDGYISPDWYGLGADQVPTWNYVAVELEGQIRRMDQQTLVAQLDALSAEQEARLHPKPPWTRDKMPAALFDRMTQAIVGFTIDVQAWRGTRKLGQNKPEAARLAAADAAVQAGRADLADRMRQL